MLGGNSALFKARGRCQAKQRWVCEELQRWVKVLAGLELVIPKCGYHIFQFEVLCLVMFPHFVCLDLEIHEIFGNLGERKSVKAMDGS